MCFDENDYITYEWHTDIFKSASVSTGMNNEESIEEVYPDILEKWKSDVLAAETSRITAESERVTAESERVAAESERVTAESERVSAESERAAAESERAAAESERVTAESERVSAESERVTAESKRVSAESERVTAESERVTAESERVTAESKRANTFAGYETEINQFKNEIVTGKDSATDNTKFAIGKAEQNLEVPTMEEFNHLAEDMTGKLDEPAEGLAVGKYFRVAAIDENGHAVLEAVDAKTVGVQDVQVAGASVVADGVANVPIATNSSAGVVQANAYDGWYMYGERLQSRTYDESAYKVANNTAVIGKGTLELNKYNLVKESMCDGKGAAWTADEQAAARDRMGIPGDWELIEEITNTEEISSFIRSTEPNGNLYNFAAVVMRADFSEVPSDIEYGSAVYYVMYNNGSMYDYFTSRKIPSTQSLWSYADCSGKCPNFNSFIAANSGASLVAERIGFISSVANEAKCMAEAIYKVKMNGLFPAGVSFTIWGVRA